jgi:hypothetical protein
MRCSIRLGCKKRHGLVSDIDIFVKRPAEIPFGEWSWRQQLTEFSLKIQGWTGNPVQIFELGDAEMNREFSSKGGVIYTIMEEGVVIYGPKDYLR